MKKIKFLITSLLLMTGTLSYCQIDTYDLSKFKLPTLNRNRLNLGFELKNSNSLLNFSGTDEVNEKRSQFNGSGRVTGEYNNYFNSERVQSTSRISSQFFVDRLSNKREIENWGTYYEVENSLLSNIEISNTTNYYISGKTFLFVSPRISYQMQHEQQNDKFKNTAGVTQGGFDSRATLKHLNTSTSIGVGFGRLELINDAQMAIYILNDLRKENRLTREPSHEEITMLAELMAIKKSESILDSRQRLIEEVKAIDSLLSNLGLANLTDASYFTTIYDNWQYSNNPDRYSGYSLSVGPKIGYYSYVNTSIIESSENNYKSFNPNFGVRADANYTKPINHKWQQSYSTGFGITKINSSYYYDPNPETEEKTINSEILGQIVFGYYPNSRTWISCSLSSIYNLINSKDNLFETEDSDFMIYSGVNGYYYFSPKLRMSFNLQMILHHNYYSQVTPYGFEDTINQVNFMGSLGVNYFIF